jgi:hypothetical protein
MRYRSVRVRFCPLASLLILWQPHANAAAHAEQAAASARAAAPAAAPAAEPARPTRLAFGVDEGLNLNRFLREGPVAGHLVLRSGHEPRLLVAFPAGNSGVGLWFEHSEQPVTWAVSGDLEPVTDRDSHGRTLLGITGNVIATATELVPRQALLSSVRILRDFQARAPIPAQIVVAPSSAPNRLVWERDRLDGAAGYRLSLEVTHGTLADGRIHAAADGKIGLHFTALSGERPLTPLAGADLLNGDAAADPAARDVLSFLSYREKFLAGSWRFDTYFGRDTLMSVRLLMPALAPGAIESGLGAVLTRLSPDGEVAHEEDVGEFAILDHLNAGEQASDRTVFDYKMIDGNFMLGAVVAAWLLDDPRGRAAAPRFLAMPDGRDGAAARAFGFDLVSNLRFVLHSATAFADAPQVDHLIALKAGFSVGQWRDSEEGLGRGRYPYDVNAVFVPAAVLAAQRLYDSGLLGPYLAGTDRAAFSRAGGIARVWNRRASGLFDVAVPNGLARQQVAAYSASLGIDPAAALASLGQASVRFHALSLGQDGAAVRILNSDEGFELLFGTPDPARLDAAFDAIMRPFPAGLVTDVGIVVANPVFAPAEVQARFGRNAYHGTVIWSWQQAVLAAGLARQLRRADLDAGLKQRLLAASDRLWQVIDAGRSLRNSELWSWNYADRHFKAAPFGADAADADESNAAQLWSTVYLAIAEPAAP